MQANLDFFIAANGLGFFAIRFPAAFPIFSGIICLHCVTANSRKRIFPCIRARQGMY